MARIARFSPLLLAVLWLAPARAEDGTVAWSKGLTTAFAEAKAEQKVLMICVNAKYVKDRKDEEPAAKGLREVVYEDARVVEASRAFVCAFLTPEGSSADYGELRTLGIDGALHSPQHIFVHPDGQEILLRRVYWSFGSGEAGVEALLAMMEKAQQRWKEEDGDGAPTGPDDAADVPTEGPERAAWIAAQIQQVVGGNSSQRQQALRRLIENDAEGDCTDPLTALLSEHKKKAILLVEIIRPLGRDGLMRAALPIAEQLGHKDPAVRGNAAVSLEYIGCGQKKVIGALRKAVDREKDEGIANHMYRALGRCGVQDAKIRALLLKKAESARSEFASYGPCIGLAYFEGDVKAARGVEKMLKKIGVPGSRRGGGQNTVKRTVLAWTLAAIGDPKSGDFVREELIAKLEHVQAFWVGGLTMFYEGVAQKCDGDAQAMAGIEAGVRATVGFAKGGNLGRYGAETRNLMDECREDRAPSSFKPKGDHLLEG